MMWLLRFWQISGSDCFDAIERVSPAILLNMRSGQLASTLMSDVELLEWFLPIHSEAFWWR